MMMFPSQYLWLKLFMCFLPTKKLINFNSRISRYTSICHLWIECLSKWGVQRSECSSAAIFESSEVLNADGDYKIVWWHWINYHSILALIFTDYPNRLESVKLKFRNSVRIRTPWTELFRPSTSILSLNQYSRSQ